VAAVHRRHEEENGKTPPTFLQLQSLAVLQKPKCPQEYHKIAPICFRGLFEFYLKNTAKKKILSLKFFFGSTGFELRATHLLGRYSTP
jgi:hypothetical protein